MTLATILTADDVTAEAIEILRSHWLPYIVSEAPHKLATALDLAAERIQAVQAGRKDDVKSIDVVLALLVENVEATATYKLQGTIADVALWILRIAGTAAVKVVLP
jgi:hypothetical protein